MKSWNNIRLISSWRTRDIYFGSGPLNMHERTGKLSNWFQYVSLQAHNFRCMVEEFPKNNPREINGQLR